MKIYIGQRQINTEENFKVIPSPEVLEYLVEDAECETIILDTCLSKYPIGQSVEFLKLALRKLRINGEIIINDIDFDLFCYLYSIKQNDITAINKLLTEIGPMGSVLTGESLQGAITELAGDSLEITSKLFSNIEFRLSYRRKS